MDETRRQVKRVLLVVLLLNALVALSKIAVGLWSGALAITADGFHSMMDGSSNAIGLVANHFASQPPDEKHPYGHRRFETMGALVIGGLLLVTAWEIVGSAVERLQGGEPPLVTPLSFGVLAVTLLANIFISRYEKREGQRLGSELVLADAAHTRTDIYVTLSVLASMVLVAQGLVWVDVLAALAIVALIVRAGWQVLRQTGSVLVDTAPYSSEQLAGWIQEVPSVKKVLRARSRGPADEAYVDVEVWIAPETTADHSAAIAEAIRKKLRQHIGSQGEIDVQFEPDERAEPDYALRARASADALGLSTHEVRISDGPQGKILEMHVEVAPDQTLDAAHEQVRQLEHDVQETLPDVVEVVTHIEPSVRQSAGRERQSANDASVLVGRAAALLRAHQPGVNWHDLHAYRLNDGFAITMHVTLPADMPIEEAHRIAEAAETLLRAELQQLERVTIHTEPFDHKD